MTAILRPILIFLSALCLSLPAYAQQPPVVQTGTVTPGHPVQWTTDGVVQDAGAANQGTLTSLGITASGPSFCINSDLTSAAGYQQFCFGVTTSGGGTISVQNFGTAPAKPFAITVNGTAYQFPFTTSGIVGPNSSVVGDLALWNNTSGTLLKDAAMSGDVTMNGSGVTALATVIGAAGPIGSPTTTPVITFDAKGRLTIVSVATIAPPWSSITGTPTTLAGYGITSPLPYAQGGCNATSQSGCTNNLFPVPTRAGDIPYWSGTAWTSVAGNNSGTNCLQESSVGGASFGSCNSGLAIYNVRLPPYNAPCNYAVGTGSMGSGSSTLTATAAIFAVGDVGKYLAIAGAGTAGATLYTTVATYISGTQVTLANSNASGGAISGKLFEYGNDDTSAFQAAVNAAVAAGGGTVYISPGSCLVSRVNLTNINGLRIAGDGTDQSRIFPLQVASYGTATGHLFDLTGSSFVRLENFQIGAFYELAAPTTAIFMGQIASGSSNRNGIDHMYISGQYSGCTFYDYGVPSLYTIKDSDFYNYSPGAGAHNVECLTATNIFNYSSSFATVTTGTQSTSDIAHLQAEFHKFAGAGADNFVVLLDSVANISFFSGVLSGGATAYVDLVGTNGALSFHNVTMETESEPVMPTNGYNIAAAATFSFLDDPGTTYIIGGSTFSTSPTSTTSVHYSH